MTDDLRDAHVLVTGAAGFIGSHLCSALRRLGASVTGVVRSEPAGGSAPTAGIRANLEDRDGVRRIVSAAGADLVVHLAGRTTRGNGRLDYQSSYAANLLATVNLVEAVLETGGCRRVVYLGSAEEYGRAPAPFDGATREMPLTAYGLSKLAATQFLRAVAATTDLPVTTLRATVVYGPGQQRHMFVPSLTRTLLAGERFPMTPGEQTRDLVYVGDIVDGIVRALRLSGRHDGPLHLSGGAPVLVRNIALLAARLVGGNAEALIDFGAIPYRDGEAMDYWALNADAKAVLGWEPSISLAEGLQRTIDHYRADQAGR